MLKTVFKIFEGIWSAKAALVKYNQLIVGRWEHTWKICENEKKEKEKTLSGNLNLHNISTKLFMLLIKCGVNYAIHKYHSKFINGSLDSAYQYVIQNMMWYIVINSKNNNNK